MTSPALSRCFPEHIRQRGTDLVHRGAVRLVRTRDGFTIATVRGSIDYVVTFGIKHHQVTVGCTCSYATGGQCCQHMWALVLTLHADRRHAEFAAQLTEVQQVVLKGSGPAAEHHGSPREPVPDEHEAPHDAPERALEPDGLTGFDDEPERWQLVLDRAESALHRSMRPSATALGTARFGTAPSTVEWPDDRRLVYVIDTHAESAGGLTLEVATERLERDGSWSAPRRFAFSTETWFAAPDPEDRHIARVLLGAAPLPDFGHARNTFVLAPGSLPSIIPRVCATGRTRLKLPTTPPTWRAVTWDGARDAHDHTAAWHFALTLTRTTERFELTGTLLRGNESRPLTEAMLLSQGTFCVIDAMIAPLESDGLWPLLAELARVPTLDIGADPGPLLSRLYALPRVPTLVLPDNLSVIEAHVRPVPGIRFVADPAPWRRAGSTTTGVQLAFRYGQVVVNSLDVGQTRFCTDTQTLHHRDADAEREARDRLVSIGASVVRDSEVRATTYAMPRSQLLRVAQQLAAEGWWVEVDGHAFRTSTGVQAQVTSGVDWFDLNGTVQYGELSATLAEVLAARKRGAYVVVLSDGSHGLLPHDWLDRLGPVLAGGAPTATGARFQSSQLALLDALLDGLPTVEVDEPFAAAREQLAGFDRIVPADPPPSFVGTLRGYQREGLGWLHFLRTFGFGGCLADDMGLGKTVQVIALLDARRLEGCGPSLVVVPRSLVFNWRAEVARFAPELRTLDWSGPERHDASLDPSSVDVVFATYGTLRRDAEHLAKITFDYVVLDEAQAIKNRGTATAKACRMLTARHRLALSGTPVENRLEELWSLLDFLNPGMLGTSARFSASLRESGDATGADATLARALRPVILRRTKAAVAPELPERIERTLEVELEPKQRVFYDQLHARVRASVLQQVDDKGIGRSRLHILEGLLRLRQAACHPVLADARRHTLPSAKLEALIPALAEVAAEGHKALVFSQFTEFLALVRAALDEEKIPYEYLDGRTKDRQARVERFQTDPAVPVFLISLKAGGHGLNLTAADYVYLLDPWWNPAVEAQAIDRAHRIGRTRRVIATRLVARNTIEEKILALQASKRALADAILTADRGGLASIGREELELLLG